MLRRTVRMMRDTAAVPKPIGTSAGDVEPPSAAIIRQAAQWLVRTTDAPDAATLAACSDWRRQDPRHELAWLRMQSMRGEFRVRDDIPLTAGTAGQTILRYCEQRSRRTALKWSIAGLGVGALTLLAAREHLWAGNTVLRTATGEQRTVALTDGTSLTLNTDTVVRVHYDAHQRRVELRSGEILVATGVDPAARPFLVNTPHAVLTPLGTRFVVRQIAADRAFTRVAVFEGRVRVEQPGVVGPTLVLQAGEQAEVGPRKLPVAQPLDGNAQAWTQGMLVANRMRLDDFLTELARYRAGILRCDARVADREVSGAFRIDDTDKTLQVVAGVLDLSLRYRTRYWVNIEPL
ncbi:FecR domain-containing protein [Alcaligenaceae bacterium A4P071]|nr:FecR domain-containing protein [Alcaligenaceae bacterium A4P071]